MGVLWITGLSGAGKTTLAKAILKQDKRKWIHLDGDELRSVLSVQHELTIESRKSLATSYSSLAKMLSEQGFDVIVSTVSLFHSIQHWNRENITNYFEVFIDADIQLIRQRNQKGVYNEGNYDLVVGLGIAHEIPLKPDYQINQTFYPDDIHHHSKSIIESLLW